MFSTVYDCYLAAETSNVEGYYLNDTELRSLCRCAQQNVVICTNDTLNNTLTYHAHDFVNDKEVVFAAIQVRPGEAVFGSRFERVQLVPSLEAAPAALRTTAGEDEMFQFMGEALKTPRTPMVLERITHTVPLRLQRCSLTNCYLPLHRLKVASQRPIRRAWKQGMQC